MKSYDDAMLRAMNERAVIIGQATNKRGEFVVFARQLDIDDKI